tara:strand:- start:422 stop:1537 length:1116 start_codon:yes stop_codon:yes gene_type:complete
MKIAYLFNSSIPSDLPSSLQVVKMCEGMQKNSHDVSLIAPMPGKGNYLKFYDIKNKFKLHRMTYFKKYPLGLNYYLFSIISIFYGIKLKSDLFITRNFFTCFLLTIFKKKTIFEIHHDISSESRVVKFLFNNFNILNSKTIVKVVAISKGVKKYLINDMGISEKKIQILPSASGLNIKNWNGKINSKKKLNIGYFGSLEKTKGINFLIKLSERDKKNNYFIFGGTDNNINSLKKKIFHRNLNLQSHVPYNKLQNYLSKMDVLVMPYYKNTIRSAGGVGNISKYMSPLKLFDYLAAGKIIIATKHNSLEEIVKNKKNCILIEKLNILNWQKEINSVLKNRLFYQNVAKNGFNLSKKYTYDIRAKKFLDLKWK